KATVYSNRAAAHSGSFFSVVRGGGAVKSQFLPASLIVLAFSLPVVSATQTKVSDPQALAFAAQSIATLTGGNLVSDITLTGTATWIAGSDTETGTVTLFAKGTSESRVDFSLSGGNRTEIRNSSGNSPQGSWVSTDGISHSDALHNCWTDAV